MPIPCDKCRDLPEDMYRILRRNGRSIGPRFDVATCFLKNSVIWNADLGELDARGVPRGYAEDDYVLEPACDFHKGKRFKTVVGLEEGMDRWVVGQVMRS